MFVKKLGVISYTHGIPFGKDKDMSNILIIPKKVVEENIPVGPELSLIPTLFWGSEDYSSWANVEGMVDDFRDNGYITGPFVGFTLPVIPSPWYTPEDQTKYRLKFTISNYTSPGQPLPNITIETFDEAVTLTSEVFNPNSFYSFPFGSIGIAVYNAGPAVILIEKIEYYKVV